MVYCRERGRAKGEKDRVRAYSHTLSGTCLPGTGEASGRELSELSELFVERFVERRPPFPAVLSAIVAGLGHLHSEPTPLSCSLSGISANTRAQLITI